MTMLLNRKIVWSAALLAIGWTGAAGAADWDDERAVRAFETLDVDNDGGVSLTEFRAGASGNLDRADSYFRRIDANDDGFISHRELRAEWDRANNVLRDDVYKLDGASQSRVMEGAFLTIDADRDGYLSRAEFEAAVKPSAGADRARKEFDRSDDNNDDRLSRSEFREDWGRFRRDLRSDVLYPPSAWGDLPVSHRQELTFDLMDLNGDGWLDEQEYRASLTARGASNARATFRGLDDNSDGLISRAELYEEWDRVGPLVRTRADWPAVGVERREIIVERRGLIDPPAAVRAGDRLFDQMDLNADGSVTLREYRATMAGTRSQTLMQFDRLDINGDGFVSRAEFNAESYNFDRRTNDREVEIEIDD